MTDPSLNTGNARTVRWTDAAALAHHRQQRSGLDYFQAMARGDIPRVPMYSVLDMRLTDVERGYSRFECDLGPHMLNPMGGIHGGIYAILMDSAAGIATQSWTEEGHAAQTVRLNVDFLRPLTASSGTVICEGRTVKAGKQVTLSDATITDKDGKLVGRAQGTFMISPISSPLTASAENQREMPAFAEREYRYEWGDTSAMLRAAPGRTGMELLTMMANGALPAPPISQTLGFQGQSFGEGTATFVCEPTERQYNPMGSMHGGMQATLIDSATGCAVQTLLPEGHGYSTVYLTCEYFRGVTVDTGLLTCTANVVKRGRRVSVADASIVDAGGKVYVRGTATCLAFPIQ